MTAFAEALEKVSAKNLLQEVHTDRLIPGTPRKMTAEERAAAKAEYDEQQKALGLYCDNPKPYVGQQVRWFPNGIDNEASLGAVVTEVGLNAVNLRVFEGGGMIPYKDGVLHLRNPEVSMRRASGKDHQFSGCWDFTPESYMLDQLKVDSQAMVEIIGELKAKVASLEEALTAPAKVQVKNG